MIIGISASLVVEILTDERHPKKAHRAFNEPYYIVELRQRTQASTPSFVEHLHDHLAAALERDNVGAEAVTPLLNGFFDTAGSIVSNIV